MRGQEILVAVFDGSSLVASGFTNDRSEAGREPSTGFELATNKVNELEGR